MGMHSPERFTPVCQYTVKLITTTAFVPKEVAIKMNLLLYRIFNELTDLI